jgi:hypothetical protein
VHARRVPVAQGCQGQLVSVLGTSDEDGVREPLVDERRALPRLGTYMT